MRTNDVGLLYNEKIGQCEKLPEPEVPNVPQPKPDPCAKVNCSAYDQKTCPTNCCFYDTGQQQCMKK